MASPKRTLSENPPSQSKFIQIVESYLAEANLTKQEFMALLKVGEAQFYRWARGDNVPTKAIVNRIAVLLARRIDEVKQNLPHNPFPASDEIDRMVNKLLETAGYSASVKGREADVSWNKMHKNKVWILGYTKVPRWIEPPDRPGGKPTGLAVKYTEQIGQLLGIETIWKYLNYGEMSVAIRSREVDGIAPFMLVLPGRFFDFRFSEQCGEDFFKLSALVAPKHSNSANFFEDLPRNLIKLIYVKGELGNWGAGVFNEADNQPENAYEDSDHAISALLGSIERNEELISVFLVDNLTGEVFADKTKKDYPSNPEKWIQVLKIREINLETYTAFAFHPDEGKLINAVNFAINMIPKIPSLRKSLGAWQ